MMKYYSMKVGLEALHAYAYAYQNQPFLHCKNQRTCLLCSLIGSLLNEICLGKKKKKIERRKKSYYNNHFHIVALETLIWQKFCAPNLKGRELQF